jgi:hypothetical protein
MLRSIRPTRARRPSDASVDPTDISANSSADPSMEELINIFEFVLPDAELRGEAD